MTRALLCALSALALLGTAAVANATPAHRDAVLASTDAWLQEVLHVPISVRADKAAPPGELAAESGYVRCAEPGVARYDPELLRRMADRSNLGFTEAWAVAAHEHGHLRGDAACVYPPGSFDAPDPVWAFYEEGFVEATRVDLFPAFMWRMFHLRVASVPMERYAANVTQVRALSVAATGSRSWRDRAAVLWRRAGLLAAWPARRAMVAGAVGLADTTSYAGSAPNPSRPVSRKLSDPATALGKSSP